MTTAAHGPASPGRSGAEGRRAVLSRDAARQLPAALWACGALLAIAALAAGLLLAGALPASAQDISINFGQGNTVTERAVQLIAVITVLSIAPSIVVMVTSFTRIVVVLSLLRTAIGLQTAPPNSVMISLALFLTAFVMSPVFTQAYDEGIRPLTENTIELDQAIERAAQPFHVFMRNQVREKDLELFVNLSGEARPASPEDVSYRILIPAFMISELRRAFEIGFLLYLPFLIIDLVVASVLMSMGMMMLPPVTISLPFKLIFFVLVDGWNLVAGSLVKSFG
ncbi:flagellar type III secretion system pore protein FliP [Prosthecomicrobium sp. N25]|uniref:flagellar type III secretion system pore protein FliP n=1 Tax=Prosthecomicrobium sp. N25 TaxID=3129254 RepID=UPI00307712DD